MAVAARPRRANKRSIVGSMGLAPYEPAPEPERQSYTNNTELRDFYLSKDGQLSRVSRLESLDVPDDARSFTSSRPASSYRQSPSIRSSDQASRMRSASRSSLRSPPPIEEEAPKQPGRLSRLLGSKERVAPGPPPDVRRRKYNKDFGANREPVAPAEELLDELHEQEADDFDDDFGADEDADAQDMPPHVDRARTAAALRTGRPGGVAAPIAELDESEDALLDVSAEDDVVEDARAQPRANGLVAAAPSSKVGILPTHEETDEDGEMPGGFSRLSLSDERPTSVAQPAASQPSPAKAKNQRVAVVAGTTAAAAGGAAAMARESSTRSRSSRKGNKADVVDEESPNHIVNSSSLVPGLTGGYLDRDVPSLGLNEPSMLGRGQKGSLRSRQTAAESEEDLPPYSGRPAKPTRAPPAAATSPERSTRTKSRPPLPFAPVVPESDSTEDYDPALSAAVLKRPASGGMRARQRSMDLGERYQDPNQPSPRARRSMDVRRSAVAAREADARAAPLSPKKSTKSDKRAGAAAAGGLAAAPLVADVSDEPERPQSRVSTRSRPRENSRLSQDGRERGTASRQSGRIPTAKNIYSESDMDEDMVSVRNGRAASIRSTTESQRKSKSQRSLLAAGGLGAGAAGATAMAASRSRSSGIDKASVRDQPIDDAGYDEIGDEVGYEEPEALSLNEDSRDGFDMRSVKTRQSAKPVEKPKKKKKSRHETGTMGISAAPKRRDVVEALTPEQRHYLLKALVSLQMQVEWSELEKLGALTLYGHPFSHDRPKLKRVKNTNLDLEGDLADGEFAAMADDPYGEIDDDEQRKLEGLNEPLILRHMFHVHLEPFPGLDSAPLKYWQKRIQPFFDEMAARNFSTSMERGETTARHFYTLVMTRYLGGFFARGFGVRGEGELRGPGKGEPGSDRWGKGKQWGKGTVKRGLDRPSRPDDQLLKRVDMLFDGDEGEAWRRARKEAQRVRRDWQALKEYNIERETGLEETMQFLDIGNIKNLPPYYRNAEEYVRQFAAYLLHSLFVTSPNADDFFSIVKGIHTLFPYWGAKQVLKVANAQTMIQGLLSLLLARPAGAKSLVQRIFVSIIGGQGSSIAKQYVAPLKKAINDDELSAKLEEYVKRGNRPEGKAIRNRAIKTEQDVLATILLHSQGTQLSESKRDDVLTMHECFVNSPFIGTLDAAYPEKTPIAKEGKVPKLDAWTTSPVDEANALKYARLRLLLRELLKARDREQACQMASGSLIPSIIKESLDTVFYGPIKRIAEHADLSARLGDLQDFIDDLIHLRKTGQNSLPDWIALAARHENSLYFLFHECAPIIKPFTEWLQAGADYMALSTTDPSHPANRSARNIEINLEDMLRDTALSRDDVEHILDEMDELEEYVKWQKVRYELEMRKNYLLSKGAAIPPSGLSVDTIPKSGQFRSQIQNIDGLLKELMDQVGVPIEDGLPRNQARGSETSELPWAWFDAQDPLRQHIEGVEIEDLAFVPRELSARVPALLYTRKALGPFRTVLRECLPAWREATAASVPGTATAPRSILVNNGNTQAPFSNGRQPASVINDRTSVKAPPAGKDAGSKSRMSMSLPRMRMPFGRK